MSDVIGRIADPASSSNDSALEYVAFDLLENGYDADEQRALLDPIEAEIRQHMDAALHDGMRHAFHNGADSGAEYAIEQIITELTFDDLPDDHPENIENEVADRLREKIDQIEWIYRDLIDETLRKAESEPAERIADWGPVV